MLEHEKRFGQLRFAHKTPRIDDAGAENASEKKTIAQETLGWMTLVQGRFGWVTPM